MLRALVPIFLFFAGSHIALAGVLDMQNPDCAKLADGAYDVKIGKFEMETDCVTGNGTTKYLVSNTTVSERMFRTQLSLYAARGDLCKGEGRITVTQNRRTFTRTCAGASVPATHTVDAAVSDTYKSFMDTLESNGATADTLMLFLPESDLSHTGTFTPVVVTPPPPIIPCRIDAKTFGVLSRGAIGSRVTQVQLRLRTLGYFNGSANGHFGPITEAAVKSYQRKKGLPVTGKVASLTIATLNAACAK